MTAGVRAWGPALLWAASIYAVSSRPSVPVGLELGLDKVAHFGAYAVFGLALARGQHASGWHWAVAVALGSLYGLADEVHQSFVPGRSPDAADWVADALGTGAGVYTFHWWRRRRPGQARRRSGAETHASPP